MPQSEIPYRHGAVRPVECYRRGWELIRGRYWLFLGVTFVGFLLGSWVPLGILMGPMLCGIYHCYLEREAGRPIAFGGLFRGFDFFLESLLATLPIFLVSFLMTLVILAVLFAEILLVVAGAGGLSGNESGAAVGFVLVSAVFVAASFVFLLALVLIPLTVFTTFAYPLIVDKRAPGFDALALSARAGWANARGLVGLFLLNMALGLAGACLCYFGALLLLPVTFAAKTVAYRQVFPESAATSGEGTAPPDPAAPCVPGEGGGE